MKKIMVVTFLTVFLCSSICVFAFDMKIYEALAYTQMFVESNLTSPESADFPPGMHRNVKDLGGNRYKVNTYVDHKNEYGATVRSHFECVVKKMKGTWELEKINFLSDEIIRGE